MKLKNIPELPEHIQARSDGQIVNIKTGKILGARQTVADNGYCKIFINHKAYLKHRLIALAFNPNPDNLPEVNHYDGVKTNNVPENLIGSSPQDNSQHAHDTGLRAYNIPCIMCDITTHEELQKFPHTKAAQKAIGKEGKVGVWEALNPERSVRKNNCAYGFYWKRDLNGENISNE